MKDVFLMQSKPFIVVGPQAYLENQKFVIQNGTYWQANCLNDLKGLIADVGEEDDDEVGVNKLTGQHALRETEKKVDQDSASEPGPSLIILSRSLCPKSLTRESSVKSFIRGGGIGKSNDQTLLKVDIVGTGGDGANTVNISTGDPDYVVQQGNRSSSSACGSADVLEELGIAIELDPEGVKRCVNKAGIGFMMSSVYHHAMQIVRPVRKQLKVKTVFNILGHMLSPARVPFAVVEAVGEIFKLHEQMNEVAPNFRRILTSRLRRLLQQEKLEKPQRQSLRISRSNTRKTSEGAETVSRVRKPISKQQLNENYIRERPVLRSNNNSGGITSSFSKTTLSKGFMIECDTPGRRRSIPKKSDCATMKISKPAEKESCEESERMSYIQNRRKDPKVPTRGNKKTKENFGYQTSSLKSGDSLRGKTNSKINFGYQTSSYEANVYDENADSRFESCLPGNKKTKENFGYQTSSLKSGDSLRGKTNSKINFGYQTSSYEANVYDENADSRFESCLPEVFYEDEDDNVLKNTTIDDDEESNLDVRMQNVGHDCPSSSANMNEDSNDVNDESPNNSIAVNEEKDTITNGATNCAPHSTEDTQTRKRDRSLFDESTNEEEEHENTKQANKKMVSMSVDKDV
ncbi:tryptophan biosynthesis 1 [Artemisia annua]|uniref:Tryptophan biosynthesis 1 n=1 Tax=Artemisia annua TaxID=35608 RepID=A0A2U1M1J0_ARTAN|nr:tryptophan biosynthesis 1 [Artemisia annua]